jgi:hypothetical protein
MYVEQNLLRKSFKMLLIYLWKIAKAFAKSNGVIIHLNDPNLVRNIVFYLFLFLIRSL